MTVVLDTGDEVTLSSENLGQSLSGTYTVGNGDNSADLQIQSISSVSMTDIFGNFATSKVWPFGQNLSDNSSLEIDTIGIAIRNATADNVTDNDVNGAVSQGDTVELNFFEAVFKVAENEDLQAAVEGIMGEQGANVSWSADKKSLSFDVTSSTVSTYEISFEDAAGNADIITFTLDVI